MDEVITNHKYRVWLHSASGMWTYYDGKVDVWAANDEEAVERARDEIKRTAFPDRPRDSWIVDKVERLNVRSY